MKDLIKQSNDILQIDSLDKEQQQTINEISLGKLSTTLFVGRMKMLTNKIKDISLRKTLMTLGYMVYTVSLQSKSLKSIQDSLDKTNLQLQKLQHQLDIQNNRTKR
jgi:hypothetical protein